MNVNKSHKKNSYTSLICGVFIIFCQRIWCWANLVKHQICFSRASHAFKQSAKPVKTTPQVMSWGIRNFFETPAILSTKWKSNQLHKVIDVVKWHGWNLVNFVNLPQNQGSTFVLTKTVSTQCNKGEEYMENATPSWGEMIFCISVTSHPNDHHM